MQTIDILGVEYRIFDQTEEENKKLNVIIPDELSPALPDDKAETIIKILAENPAPRYIDDPEREYGMDFGGYNIRFTTDGETATVTKIEKTK